jgi:hypothetical protein
VKDVPRRSQLIRVHDISPVLQGGNAPKAEHGFAKGAKMPWLRDTSSKESALGAQSDQSSQRVDATYVVASEHGHADDCEDVHHKKKKQCDVQHR